ncbi:tumor protein p53-inducible protein 13 isoform X2 [Phodopus roborovskii]|uniref:tumor protein p53-inducible protein 13 isoform X2 n=1 Tax=Phodopus roborovskii TaxID=109678 RepID=UPI0021E490FC|nr:tumor protein p53-inducible protein 13 isoform X2 [Phodopus roborovskii]
MVPPPPPPPRLLLVALVGLLSLCEVVVEPAVEEAGTGCPEGLWPLPPQVLPRVTHRQLDGVAFLYHPCAHPWLKLQLALLAHVCVAKPTLIPDTNLTWDRPLVLTAWGAALEMAWIEPAWAARWLKRRRRRQQRKNMWFLSDTVSGSTPMMPAPSRGKPCGRRCVQAPTLAFALRSWRPPGVEVTSRAPLSIVKRRGLRAALGLQSTPSGLRVSLASSQSLKAQQPVLVTASVALVSLMTGGPGGNGRSRTEARMPSGQDNPEGCACPGQASPAPQAAAPPRVARGPTPRTEEAAWAAMALTFLLVLLTLATLCTRLHRNFRRSESIYWGPTADSQDTVAAVLKRRLPLSSRRTKRSRRRPLLPPTPDSRPDSESSD